MQTAVSCRQPSCQACMEGRTQVPVQLRGDASILLPPTSSASGLVKGLLCESTLPGRGCGMPCGPQGSRAACFSAWLAG